MSEPEYLAAVEIDEPPEDSDPGSGQIDGWVGVHEFDLQVIGSPEEPEDDGLLTYDEWWQDYADNACCPTPFAAADSFCGCRGSGAIPSGISRLLTHDDDY
jgi:hypothetical protein